MAESVGCAPISMSTACTLPTILRFHSCCCTRDRGFSGSRILVLLSTKYSTAKPAHDPRIVSQFAPGLPSIYRKDRCMQRDAASAFTQPSTAQATPQAWSWTRDSHCNGYAVAHSAVAKQSYALVGGRSGAREGLVCCLSPSGHLRLSEFQSLSQISVCSRSARRGANLALVFLHQSASTPVVQGRFRLRPGIHLTQRIHPSRCRTLRRATYPLLSRGALAQTTGSCWSTTRTTMGRRLAP